MTEPRTIFKGMQRKHEYLVAIDSDGCAFDTMELKHKECFIPNIIRHWGLQAVSKYARAAGEFVNLYSQDRGCNRFPALVKVFQLLREWPAVAGRGAAIPDVPSVEAWIERESRLGNPALREEVARTGDAVLARALRWSEAVNESVAETVSGVPPFAGVKECLKKFAPLADIIVCSATPVEALVREWEEHGIAGYVEVIAGQEMGSKAEHIRLACDGRYSPDHILMIGDAPGDRRAAEANDALFFPILPGDEERSWELLLKEGADRFLSGNYAGFYEASLIEQFSARLPETPPWG